MRDLDHVSGHQPREWLKLRDHAPVMQPRRSWTPAPRRGSLQLTLGTSRRNSPGSLAWPKASNRGTLDPEPDL